MRIRIVLIPPADVRRRTAKLAKKVSVIGAHYFIVDNTNLIPHITICSLDVAEELIPKVVRAVTEAILNISPIRLKLNRYRLVEGVWCGWYMNSTKRLHELRHRVCNALQRVDGVTLRFKTTYEPHITLTKFKRRRTASTLALLDTDPEYLFTTSLVAVTYDKDTQVPGIIKQLRLRDNV